MKPALFSANSEGACPNCNGAGVIYTDLAMMAGVTTVCEVCEGKRFQAEVLEYKFGGRDISEVLAMSVSEAEDFFGSGDARTPAAHKILDRLADVGLGYLSLGQPLTTLSGGERQRLKLATQMADKGDIYVLDEPTTGLHLADIAQLLGLLDRLVDSGKSVVVIEHHQAVMAHADWIIDLGPGAGHDGGKIVFEGTPADLVADRKPSPASTSPPMPERTVALRRQAAGQPWRFGWFSAVPAFFDCVVDSLQNHRIPGDRAFPAELEFIGECDCVNIGPSHASSVWQCRIREGCRERALQSDHRIIRPDCWEAAWAREVITTDQGHRNTLQRVSLAR